MKDSPGWHVHQDNAGNFTFITPSRRAYRTRPPRADGEVKPVETIEIPKPPEPPLVEYGPPPF
jgi:hypothetical protein